MIDNRAVGRKIARLRQEGGLTQQQLAAILNVSHQAVSKWEGGQAMPDIQTLLALTRFFGLTVEQLICAEAADGENSEYEASPARDTDGREEEVREGTESEESAMSIQQLLQMAPYMSREIVEEIVLEMNGPLSAAQIAKIAPYVRSECVEQLLEKHRPELTWENLRRIAPHMRREAVDELARAIASGRESVKPANEGFNRTINDIGKAFDDLGKGVGQAVQKAIRFGENVFSEVSSAISDLSSDAEAASTTPARSERAVALRKKAFERALKDGKWEWIAGHLDEIEADAELKARIAGRARELGMHDWICTNMGGYADEFSVEAAISSGNWTWLGENAWKLKEPMQEKVALAAMRAENWQWLGRYSDQLNLSGCGAEIARTAFDKGAKVLAAQIAEHHLETEEIDELARAVHAADDFDTLELLAGRCSGECLLELMGEMAERREWQRVGALVRYAGAEAVEALMEKAVDQGNFEAVDMLDAYL